MSEISQTADKALALLELLAELDDATPQQLSRDAGMNRTVVQRLLTTLLTRGFVTGSAGRYRLSPRIGRLAAAVQPRLRGIVVPVDADLSAATGETVVFSILDETSVVVLDEAVQHAPVAVRVRHEVGSRSPLPQNASGLAILAALDRPARRRLLGRLDHDGTALDERLATIERSGYALTSDELQDGVSGLAAAVVVEEDVVGSLAVLVPTARLADLERHRADLARAVARIVEALR